MTPDARGRRLVVDLPLRIPAWLGAAVTVAVLLVLFGAFHAWTFLPVAAVAAATADRLVPRSAPDLRDHPQVLPATAWALGGALVWVILAVPFAAEYLFAYRDPATYAITGIRLTHHASVDFPRYDALFGSSLHLVSSLGFQGTDGSHWFPQGAHGLPALLAVGGWLAGVTGVLAANCVIGGLGLVSCYGLARCLSGPRWGLLAPAALATSLPMLWFSRGAYTEPLALCLTLGGLALLWTAWRRSDPRAFGLAGFVLGAVCSVRIDGLLIIVALVPVAALLAGQGRLAEARWLLLGWLAAAAVGLADVLSLSPRYAHDLRGHLLLIGAGAAAAAALSVLLLRRWRRDLGGWYRRHRGRVATVAGLLVLVGFAVLASRPLWLVSRHGSEKSAAIIASYQRSFGLPVDPLRSYDERSVTWISWYHGWPLIVLGALGLAALLTRVLRGSDLRPVGLVAVFGVIGGLYLNRVSIYPDQIWAARRFLPEVVPLLLVAAVTVVVAVAAAVPKRMRRLVALLAAAALMVPPAVETAPVFGLKDYAGLRAEYAGVCRAIGPRAALVAVGRALDRTVPPALGVLCGVPVVGTGHAPAADLAQVRKRVAARGRVLYVVTTDLGAVSWRSPVERPTVTATVHKLAERLDNRRQDYRYTDRLYVGRVGADGRSYPVPPVAGGVTATTAKS